MHKGGDDEVTMRYEGRYEDYQELVCVLTWRGTEYRFAYKNMTYIAQLYDVPEAVREYILFWAELMNNPD